MKGVSWAKALCRLPQGRGVAGQARVRASASGGGSSPRCWEALVGKRGERAGRGWQACRTVHQPEALALIFGQTRIRILEFFGAAHPEHLPPAGARPQQP